MSAHNTTENTETGRHHIMPMRARESATSSHIMRPLMQCCVAHIGARPCPHVRGCSCTDLRPSGHELACIYTSTHTQSKANDTHQGIRYKHTTRTRVPQHATPCWRILSPLSVICALRCACLLCCADLLMAVLSSLAGSNLRLNCTTQRDKR